MEESSTGTSGSDSRRPVPRRSHKKSKTGCATCRIRKVKCDERRPLCINCERHFRNLIACDFDNQAPVIDTGERARRPVPVESQNERQTRQRQPGPSSGARQASDVGRQAEPLGLPPTIRPGRVDPFETTPATPEPAPTVDALIAHYFAYRSFPLYANRLLIEEWWPFVRDDDLLFHVTLLLSSLDRQRLRSQPDPVHSRRLLDECLGLLNLRMQDDSKRINDHTLASIAALSAIENDRGNVRALNMHLEGLTKIIDLRGGLDEVRKTNPMAANFVFWCGMVCEPTFLPLKYGDQDSDDPGWLYNTETMTLLTHDGGEANLDDFGVDVVTANILHKVQLLSRSYWSTLRYNTAQEATAVLSNLCSLLQQLLRLSKEPSVDSPIAGLSQSCRVAACLHLFVPQAGYFPDPTLMLNMLVRDLKESLAHMIRAIGTNSYLLLWLLSVGGIAAHAMPAERIWFVGHLVVVATDLQIQSWDVMRQNLVRLAFHDNFCDVSFQTLWNDVHEKQKSLGATFVER